MKKSDSYHPIWYQRNRPFAKHTRHAVNELGLTGDAMRQIQERIMREWNTALDTKRVDKEKISTDHLREVSIALYYGFFAANGYNLFSFGDKLGEMLANTKATDIPLDALISPYPSYYIQFHEPIMWGNLGISGAYIIDIEAVPAFQVCLTIQPIDVTAHWMSAPAGYFYLPLKRDTGKPLGELIQSAIDNEITAKWQHATASMPIEDSSIIDIREQRAKRESMDLSSARDSIQKAMEYLANCLCYLTSQQSGYVDYPPDTPASLKELTITAKTERQKEKAQSQLKSMGFHKITYVDLQLKTETDAEINSASSANGVRKQHWRRGHWRNQRHGKGFSETMLVWIRPTLVGEATQESMDETVREYRLLN